MSSASKKTDKGKKRATSAELDNNRLLEKLEAEKALIAQRIAELKAARAYVDGGNDDDADNGGDEDDGEDEREEHREAGISAGTGRSGTGRPGTGEKRRAPERSESPAVKRSWKENPWEVTLSQALRVMHHATGEGFGWVRLWPLPLQEGALQLQTQGPQDVYVCGFGGGSG
ncbi:hypothetical protein GGX14DRAFT_394998 [Mycena pura]|uniref:Uncharacterized protein n=1 Tax=Mycena pura TaxID=153505 RepID=A0AAD6YCQ5_9AGAR|nr:hypothetical protein GGX14DRAFT_394998 [Mycena pura]